MRLLFLVCVCGAMSSQASANNGWVQDPLGAWYKSIGNTHSILAQAELAVFRTKQGEVQFSVILPCSRSGEMMRVTWVGTKKPQILDRQDCPLEEERRVDITPESMWKHFGALPIQP